MAVTQKVILDAGHGGAEPGAVYAGRPEKDDNLKLALAVGKLLAEKGVDVMFTRIDDTYQTPYEKAEIGNRSGADYFVSFHRNAMPLFRSADPRFCRSLHPLDEAGRLQVASNLFFQKSTKKP